MEKLDTEHIFGADPNVAAGQRIIKLVDSFMSAQASQFMYVGYGSFTLHIRVLDPGWNCNGGGYFFFEIGNQKGYKIGIGPNSGQPQFFRIIVGQGIVMRSNVPYTRDGQYHSFTVVRNSNDYASAGDPANTKMFFDLVQVTDYITAINPNQDNSADPEPNSIMQIGGGNNPAHSYIDRFYFFDRGLSAAEVALLDSPQHTVAGAKMLHEYNQATGRTAFDSSSVKNNTTIPAFMGGDWENTILNRFWFRNDAVKLIAPAVTLAAPMNGHFQPSEQVLVKGIAWATGDPAGGGLTQVQYSADGIAWTTLVFDNKQLATTATFQPVVIEPGSPQPILYLRATNVNPNYCGCIELICA